MDSFDGSRAGAFVESRAGARNIVGRAIVMVINWLDESDPAYLRDRPTAPWARDTQAWDEIVSIRNRDAFVAAVFDAPTPPESGEGEFIKPAGLPFPDAVTVVNVPREPDVSEIVSFVLSLIPPGASVSALRFQVDESGSMTRATIEPAFTEALMRLPRSLGVPSLQIEVHEYDDERWLRALGSAIMELVPVEP